MPNNMSSCSKVQVLVAALAALVIAVVVFAVGFGAGATYTSRQMQRLSDIAYDDEVPPFTTSPPPFT